MAKVFISYAHEPSINGKVFDFANRLRTEFAIDAEIDQYEEAPAEGWPKWMMRQIQESVFVLVVASKLYNERASDFSGSKEGAGVKWETNMVLQELYLNPASNTKYIPILFNEFDTINIPLPLQPYTYYDVTDPDQLNKLVNRLKGLSKSKRPPLGSKVDIDESLDAKPRKSLFFSTIIDVDLWNEAKWGGVVYASFQDGSEPPTMALFFANYEYGRKIFEGWKNVFGQNDVNDEIRISIVEDIFAEKPMAYGVSIGSNPRVIADKMSTIGMDLHNDLQINLSRIHFMYPTTTENLDRFKRDCKQHKKFNLALAIVDKESLAAKLDPRYSIEKREISFKTRAEVERNPNDIDQSMLNPCS
ncbi:SEFIR domain-containing protein [Fibrobacter sp. UWH5]|uniref:SEFIR domain-containing protein n=1 Tax=Fibrobacter sp. UWH5 TaxID=1896211 RepID=UPI000919E1CA|nr:SEFIR domain-containing protein [Fibrobacter sp. UWH5]SHK42751.1 SEFIR domain-containing protein [Fibrobacter sp. UWH5]